MMKTFARTFVVSILVIVGLKDAAAQSSASSSKEVREITNTINEPQLSTSTIDTIPYDPRTDRGIPLPKHIQYLMQNGKVPEALVEFDKFKATQKKARPYDLMYLEMTVYQHAQEDDPDNSERYAQKATTLKQEIIQNYPNESDTYLLLIDENTPDEKIIELTTKAIEADVDNIYAYERRGRVLFELGQTKEACKDFNQLPWKNNMPEYRQCKNLK